MVPTADITHNDTRNFAAFLKPPSVSYPQSRHTTSWAFLPASAAELLPDVAVLLGAVVVVQPVSAAAEH
jgi:hypothetical protein